MRLVAIATLALLLAGCTAALPEAALPQEPGHPWTDAEGGLWVVRHVSCVECSSGTESAVNELTLLYRDGSILHATYGSGGQAQIEGYPQAEGSRDGLTFVDPADDAAHRDEITQAWKAMAGADPHLVRVHDLDALKIDSTESEDILRVVDHALTQSDDLANSYAAPCAVEATCIDGQEVTFFSYGHPRELTGPHTSSAGQGDDGWRLLDEQFAELKTWLGAGTS